MAVTHWMDGGIPRHLSLPFTQSGTTATIAVPVTAEQAPQGWYLLFGLVDDIPSNGVMVHLTRSVPAELATVQVSGRGPTTVTWSGARSGGTPATYEVASGALSQLRSSGSFEAGVCLASSLGSGPFADARPSPPVGEGYYYMVRARNDSFVGSYGSALRDQHGIGAGDPCP